jgi:hypothetical protein
MKKFVAFAKGNIGHFLTLVCGKSYDFMISIEKRFANYKLVEYTANGPQVDFLAKLGRLTKDFWGSITCSSTAVFRCFGPFGASLDGHPKVGDLPSVCWTVIEDYASVKLSLQNTISGFQIPVYISFGMDIQHTGTMSFRIFSIHRSMVSDDKSMSESVDTGGKENGKFCRM